MSRTAELYDQEYLGDGVYVGHDGYHIVMWLESPGAFGLNAIALEPEALRALHRYVERVTTTQGGEMSDETTDRIRETLATPAAGEDLRERWVGRLTFHLADYVNGLAPTLRIGETDAQELLALLRTPAAPVREDVRERAALEIERGILAALDGADEEGAPLEVARAVARRLATTGLLRTSSGEGEAQTQKVEAVLRRWNRLAGDVEGSDGPLTETEIAAISRDVAAALRSEAPGEDVRTPSGEGGELWREVDDLLARLERFEYDATGESEEYWRVVTIRDRIAAARRGEGGGE